MDKSHDFFKKFITNLMPIVKSPKTFDTFNEEKKTIKKWFDQCDLGCTMNYEDFENITLKFLFAFLKTLDSGINGGGLLYDENGNLLSDASPKKCSIKTNIIKLILILLFITSLISNINIEKNTEYQELAVLNNLEHQPEYITRIEDVSVLKDPGKYIEETIKLSKLYIEGEINATTPKITAYCRYKYRAGREVDKAETDMSRIMRNMVKASVADTKAMAGCMRGMNDALEKKLLNEVKDIIETREIEMRRIRKNINKSEEDIYLTEVGMGISLAGLATIYAVGKLKNTSKKQNIETLNENIQSIEPIVWKYIERITPSPSPEPEPAKPSHSQLVRQMKLRVIASTPEPPPYRSASYRARSPPRARSPSRARSYLNRSPSPIRRTSSGPRTGGKTHKHKRKIHKRKTHRR